MLWSLLTHCITLNFLSLWRFYSRVYFLWLLAVIWEAGFPHWHAGSVLQPALSFRQRRSHQPPSCCRLCPGPVHAHPGTTPTTPLSDSAPPPAAGWTGTARFWPDLWEQGTYQPVPLSVLLLCECVWADLCRDQSAESVCTRLSQCLTKHVAWSDES